MSSIFKVKNWSIIFSTLFACFFFVNKSFAEVVVIVHPSNTSTFDQSDIKKIFLGKSKKFSNGRTAIALNADDSMSFTDEFNTKVIGKSSSQLNAYWSKKIFTGKGTPPQKMSTSAEIIDAVSSNPDAIGYIDKSAVTDNIKIVATF